MEAEREEGVEFGLRAGEGVYEAEAGGEGEAREVRG